MTDAISLLLISNEKFEELLKDSENLSIVECTGAKGKEVFWKIKSSKNDGRIPQELAERLKYLVQLLLHSFKGTVETFLFQGQRMRKTYVEMFALTKMKSYKCGSTTSETTLSLLNFRKRSGWLCVQDWGLCEICLLLHLEITWLLYFILPSMKNPFKIF